MEQSVVIQVLLIAEDEETIRTISRLLVHEDERRFRITSVRDIPSTVKELSGSQVFDLILLEFDLVRSGGTESIAAIRGKEPRSPIIFLGARKDLSMAVEAMRVGGRDYLPTEDLDAHVFPQMLIRHHERHQLGVGVDQLEIKRGRLEAMQEMIVSVTEEISDPIEEMRSTVAALEARNPDEKAMKYLLLIRENLDRLSDKVEKLKNLKHDKTVKYIKNINMIDLS